LLVSALVSVPCLANRLRDGHYVDLFRRTLKIDELSDNGGINTFPVVNKIMKRLVDRQRFMTANDQLNLLRMLRECKRLREAEDEHAMKWKDFAVTILQNIPVAFLHDFDLPKL